MSARLHTLPTHTTLAVLTPSHHFPLGGRLSLARRHGFLDWAATSGALLVELDAGDELHDPKAYLPCLCTLSNGIPVAHLGTFEHLFTDDMKLGYLLLPEELIPPAETFIATTRTQPSTLMQSAAAELFDVGEVARYIDRMNHTHDQKRTILREWLSTAPIGQLNGTHGNHAVLDLGDMDAEPISGKLAQGGILVPRAAQYFQFLPVDRNALILGYTHLSNAEVEQGITALETVLRES